MWATLALSVNFFRGQTLTTNRQVSGHYTGHLRRSSTFPKIAFIFAKSSYRSITFLLYSAFSSTAHPLRSFKPLEQRSVRVILHRRTIRLFPFAQAPKYISAPPTFRAEATYPSLEPAPGANQPESTCRGIYPFRTREKLDQAHIDPSWT